jgi:hypothetical protein
MEMPERITGKWIDSLGDEKLLQAEAALHKVFSKLDGQERKRLGNAYDLMRGPAELMSAWDRWTRVNTETRSRGLNPQRR